MDVSVVLVNHNNCGLITACIDSIFAHTEGVDFEVVVVDNHSTGDDSRAVLSADPRIRYHYLDSNLGFGRANNYGAERSTGRYLFFLNSDTVLLNNAVKAFFDYCESRPAEPVGVVGCMLEDSDGATVHSYGPFPTMRGVLWSHIAGPLRTLAGLPRRRPGLERLAAGSFDVDYVTGADMFVPRSVYDRFGGFDPDFFLYYEETEMQLRYARHGLARRIISGPRIVHLEGGSFRQPGGKPQSRIPNRMRYNQESQFTYMRKTRPRLACALFRCCLYLVRLPLLLTLPAADRKAYHRILTSRSAAGPTPRA